MTIKREFLSCLVRCSWSAYKFKLAVLYLLVVFVWLLLHQVQDRRSICMLNKGDFCSRVHLSCVCVCAGCCLLSVNAVVLCVFFMQTHSPSTLSWATVWQADSCQEVQSMFLAWSVALNILITISGSNRTPLGCRGMRDLQRVNVQLLNVQTLILCFLLMWMEVNLQGKLPTFCGRYPNQPISSLCAAPRMCLWSSASILQSVLF